MSRVIPFVVVAALVAAGPVRLSAWGFPAHRHVGDRMIGLLPAELRPLFEARRAFIVERVVDPDLWRNVGWDQESPNHFLDLDSFGTYPFEALPREYDQAVQKFGRDEVHEQGLLPWRTAEFYGRLERAFASLAKPSPSQYVLDDIVLFSAILCHYVADGHVPLHAVANYDGQLSGQLGAHSRFESQLFERFSGELTMAPVSRAPVTDPRGDMFRISAREQSPGRARAGRRSRRRRRPRVLRRRLLRGVQARHAADRRPAHRRRHQRDRGLHHRGVAAGGPPGRSHPAVTIAAPDCQAGGPARRVGRNLDRPAVVTLSGMQVYLIPIGRDKYEPYFEDDEPDAADAPVETSLFGRLRRRMRDMLREAEAERHRFHETAAAGANPGLMARLRRKAMRRIVERAAEQRLLWHLRTASSATLEAPDDLSSEAAPRDSSG